jgi:hypothetical protein
VRERGKGTKGSERVIGKAAGDECVFIPGEGPGWQMRSVRRHTGRGRRSYYAPLQSQKTSNLLDGCAYTKCQRTAKPYAETCIEPKRLVFVTMSTKSDDLK